MHELKQAAGPTTVYQLVEIAVRYRYFFIEITCDCKGKLAIKYNLANIFFRTQLRRKCTLRSTALNSKNVNDIVYDGPHKHKS